MSNAYSSLSDTFVASDLYNLPMPAVPPADLTIAVAQFAPSYLYFRVGASGRVVGFNKADKPFFRAVGMGSNLADGLVDSALDHVAHGWQLRYQLGRYAAALTGTIVNVAGSNVIGGSGTLFTQELAIGSVIVWSDQNFCVRSGTVATIVNDGSLTLTAATANTGMLTANTVLSPVYPRIGDAGLSVTLPFLTLNNLYPVEFFLGDVSKVYPPKGSVNTVAASTAISGLGTSFLTDFVVGQPLAWGKGASRRTGVVATIVDNTHMTLTAAQDVGQQAPLLDYDNHLRIRCNVINIFGAYTLTIDPAFGNGTRRLSISGMATVEHSYPLSVAI